MKKQDVNGIIKKAFLLLFFCAVSISYSCADDFSVMYYNLCNYFITPGRSKPKKKEASKKALMGMIKAANPDVIMIAEMGPKKSFDDFKKYLKNAGLDYKYFKIITAADKVRHLGIAAKSAPTAVIAQTDLKFKIKPKKGKEPEDFPVLRGFMHVIYKFPNNYTLHVISAHLKSRLFHSRFNQTDIRRYEARQLRYYVDDIIKKEPEANILVMGDLNDTFDTSPLKTLRAKGKKINERLYDLRPLDQLGMSWTHWWNMEDSYQRIDYALSSSGLLPEVNFKKSRIHHVPELWMFASDHRPLLIFINPEEKKALPKDKIKDQFPKGIYNFKP